MELKRLERAVADRWALVVGIAVLGVVAALLLGNIASKNQQSQFQSTAAIRFAPPEGGTATELAAAIAEAVELANTAAEDILDEHPDWLIVEDLANQRLTFVAHGPSRGESEAGARQLRQSYLDVDPTLGGSVETLLAGVKAQAEEVQSQIDLLVPGIGPADQALIDQHARLDARIEVINGRLDQLLIEEAAANTEGRVSIAAQRSFLETQLTNLQTEKATLPPPPPLEPDLTVEEALQLTALQQRLAGLTADYQRLFLRQLGVTDDEVQDIVSTIDLTPEPTAPIVNAAFGLVGGLLIALLAILFLNRTRRPVWLAEDVPLPLLGNVPARRVGVDTSENWYDSAEPGPRKSSIQALRSAVEAQVPGSGATIAITGLGTAAEGVQALSADLASSLASAGTSVLLVDANFESRSPVGQYKGSGSSVATVLGLNPTAPEFEATVRHTVDNAFRVRAGLSVLPAGPPPASPADELAGRQFRQLVTVAQEMYDVVVVVVDSADHPAAQVAMQRLGYGVLVMTPGDVTIPEVDAVVRDLKRLRITMLGSVFLGKESHLLPRSPARPEAPKPIAKAAVVVEAAPLSPISRLHNYPMPDERRTAVIPHRSLDGLAENIGVPQQLESNDEFGPQLLTAIEEAAPTHAMESVSGYLVSQTEDMVLARHGQGGLSEDLMSAMSDYGFLSLRQLRGMRTPSAWLDHEIASEVGPGWAAALIESMEATLGEGGAAVRIDEWLDEEFFNRHLERTNGEPTVWHLTSPRRTVSILVPARRLTSQQFELILAEVAGRTVDDLERQRAASVKTADFLAVSDLESGLEDARQFEAAVTRLITVEGNGRRRGSEGWRPDWSKGTRVNLAPLQEAGLLPFKVLSTDEMSEVLASA